MKIITPDIINKEKVINLYTFDKGFSPVSRKSSKKQGEDQSSPEKVCTPFSINYS